MVQGRTRIGVLAGAAILSTCLAGCDGDEGPTRAEFAEAAADACDRSLERLRELGVPQTRDELVRFEQEAGEVYAGYVESLREIEPPPEDREEVDEMIDHYAAAAELLPRIAQAARDRDLAEAQRLNAEFSEQKEAGGEIASRFGIGDCGISSDPGPVI